jgi:glycosyltransferase involved in cell wall biosynthesis
MNIALVIPEFNLIEGNYRSLSVYTYRTAKSLIQLGHRPVIFTTGLQNEKINYDEIEIHFTKINKRDEKWYSNKFLHKPYSLARKAFYQKTAWHKLNDHLEKKLYPETLSEQLNDTLLQAHKEIKFDIIHYAQENAPGYCKPDNIPVEIRVSLPHKINMTHEGFIADKYIRSRHNFEIKALQKADALFGSASEIIEILEKELKRKITSIEPTYVSTVSKIDDSVYEKQLTGKKYILFYGTLNMKNGTDTVADMMADFLRQHTDYYFVFVGEHSVSPYPKLNMLQYVQKKAMEHSNRLICFDNLPQSQLFPIIKNSFAVVLPSRYDSFSNSKIEALAHKRIVVGTKNVGDEKLIENNKNGFLITKEGHKELLYTLTNIILLSAQKKQEMEEESGKRILNLSPETAGKHLVDFYIKTISSFKSKQVL